MIEGTINGFPFRAALEQNAKAGPSLKTPNLCALLPTPTLAKPSASKSPASTAN
jgi:hypothetical protein